MVELVVPYSPRPLQQQLHDDPTRFKVLVWHRRAGKTVWAINQGVRRAIQCYGEGLKNPVLLILLLFKTSANCGVGLC